MVVVSFSVMIKRQEVMFLDVKVIQSAPQFHHFRLFLNQISFTFGQLVSDRLQ